MKDFKFIKYLLVITKENLDFDQIFMLWWSVNHRCQQLCTLAFRVPHAHDETVQLTAQEVALLLQLLDALLQPGVLLQSDIQVSSQVGHQDEGVVLGVRGLLHHSLWDNGWDISIINTSQKFTLNIFIQELLTDLRSYNPKYSERSYKIMVLIGGHVLYTRSTVYHLLALVQVVAGWSIHALLQGKWHLIGVKIQASPSSSFFCWRCRWWRCLSFIVFF